MKYLLTYLLIFLLYLPNNNYQIQVMKFFWKNCDINFQIAWNYLILAILQNFIENLNYIIPKKSKNTLKFDYE